MKHIGWDSVCAMELTPDQRSFAAFSSTTQIRCIAALHRMFWQWMLYCLSGKRNQVTKSDHWYSYHETWQKQLLNNRRITCILVIDWYLPIFGHFEITVFLLTEVLHIIKLQNFSLKQHASYLLCIKLHYVQYFSLSTSFSLDCH